MIIFIQIKHSIRKFYLIWQQCFIFKYIFIWTYRNSEIFICYKTLFDTRLCLAKTIIQYRLIFENNTRRL